MAQSFGSLYASELFWGAFFPEFHFDWCFFVERNYNVFLKSIVVWR